MRKVFLLGVLLFFASNVFGQGARYNDAVTDQAGRPVPAATVYVCALTATGTPCSPTVEIYSDSGLTQPIANPLTTDNYGRYGFWIAIGSYLQQTSGQGIVTYTEPFTVGGSSTSVSVNGTSVSNPNFNNTTPSAGSGYVNAQLLNSGSNVSVIVPEASLGLTAWNSILPPSGNLILPMSTYQNQFNFNFSNLLPEPGFTWANLFPASSTISQQSPQLQLCGNYWTGSVSSPDCWWLADYPTNGSSSTSVLSFLHNGAGTNEVSASVFVATSNMGIGSGVWTPVNPLDVKGGAAFGSYAGVNGAPSGGIIASGDVGIGTAFPTVPLHIATTGIGENIDFFGASSSVAGARLNLRAAEGTQASPTNVQSGDYLGSLQGFGYNNGSYAFGARIHFLAMQNWGASAQGSAVGFDTTPLNSTGTSEIARFEPSGGLSVGSSILSTDPGLGNAVFSGTVGVASLGATTGTPACLNSSTFAGFYALAQCNSPLIPWAQFAGQTSNSTVQTNGYSTTLVQNNGINNLMLDLQNAWPATSILNQASPLLEFDGQYWNGSASALDQWTFNTIPGSSSSIFDIAHGAGPSGAIVEMPSILDESATSYGVPYVTETGGHASVFGYTAAGTTGQCLLANTSAAPTWGTCSSGSTGANYTLSNLTGPTAVNLTTLTFAGAAGLTASGTNQSVTLTPSGSGQVVASGELSIGTFASATTVPVCSNSGVLATCSGLAVGSSYTQNGVLYGNASNVISATSAGSSGAPLLAGSPPTFGPLNLAGSSSVTGILPLANLPGGGGTSVNGQNCALGSSCVANPPLDKSTYGLSNPTADATFTYPASSVNGFTLAGTAPASSSSGGTNASDLFQVTGATGGATSSVGSDSAGQGSSPYMIGGAGGNATGAGTAYGGFGGSILLEGGGGGNGTAGNDNGGSGGSIYLEPGGGGSASGSGTAGVSGNVVMQSSNPFSLLLVDVNPSAITNSPSLYWGGRYEATSGPTYAYDSWTTKDVIGSGVNGTSTLTFTQSGSTGFAALQVPNLSVASISSGTSPVCANGTSASFTSSGCIVSQSGPVHSTGNVGAISTSTLCAASAGGCNNAGEYEVSWNFVQGGTACSLVGSGGVTFLLTWTDASGTHSAVSLPMDDASAITSLSQTFHFQTSNTAAWGSGKFVVWSTGANPIQYATGYTGCTTGTGTYELDAAVVRLQ